MSTFSPSSEFDNFTHATSEFLFLPSLMLHLLAKPVIFPSRCSRGSFTSSLQPDILGAHFPHRVVHRALGNMLGSVNIKDKVTKFKLCSREILIWTSTTKNYIAVLHQLWHATLHPCQYLTHMHVCTSITSRKQKQFHCGLTLCCSEGLNSWSLLVSTVIFINGGMLDYRNSNMNSKLLEWDG